MRFKELLQAVDDIHKLCSTSNEDIKNAVGKLRNDLLMADCIHQNYCDCYDECTKCEDK